MTNKPKISADTSMCKGQSPDGENVCGYRERCLRYMAKPNKGQDFKPFYLAGDDCPQYLSIPK